MRIPHFSNYDGGDKFTYQEKIFNQVALLGGGSFGHASLFETKDEKQCCVVKSEKSHSRYYSYGDIFKDEAGWYKKIYGLGEFSGNIENDRTPHHILIPYFSGEILGIKNFQSVKELFFYWIWTAIATRHLHQAHHVVHGDLKIDNVIAGSHAVFLIDFNLVTRIGKKRKIEFQPEDKIFILHQPQELFFGSEAEKKADPSQDIYCLGYLLRELFFRYFVDHVSPELLNAKEKVICVAKNMMHCHPTERWPIEKGIYMLSIACLSQMPKNVWYDVAHDATPHHAQSIFIIAIQARIDELEKEQKNLRSPSLIKEKKITRLIELQKNIARKPSRAVEAIFQAKKDKTLIAGVFLHRTESLLSELGEIGRTLTLMT